MNEFTNLEPYDTRVEDVVCRDCGKTFQFYAQYDKNGIPVSFQPKYCKECNLKPKLTGNNGSWGTVNIESAKVPQRNVEGLTDDLSALSVGIEESYNEFRAFKKHIEHDIEHNKDVVEDKLYSHNKRIDDNKINLDVFKSTQAEFNTKQSDFNISVLQLVKEIHKSLIVGFSLLIILMLVTWSYLTYTHFKH